MKIRLDQDGVITDFDKGCQEIFQWPKRPRRPLEDTRHYLNLTTFKFWEILDREGENWWRDLDFEPGARDLITLVENYDKNWKFLTSPSRSHYAASGKVLWIQKNFGKMFNRYHITPAINKQDHAREDTVLIDDNDRNCKQFIESGGHSILYPQIWNKNHEIILPSDKLKFVKNELDKIKETLQ